jgi:hypothetical protein
MMFSQRIGSAVRAGGRQNGGTLISDLGGLSRTSSAQLLPSGRLLRSKSAASRCIWAKERAHRQEVEVEALETA